PTVEGGAGGRRVPGEFDGFRKGRRVGHNRGRRHYAAAASFHDGAVHAVGQAKVVSVNNETAHAESLANEALSTQRHSALPHPCRDSMLEHLTTHARKRHVSR